MPKKLRVDWGEADKAQDKRKRWLGSWLVSRDGEEGENFYEGPGGAETTHDIPAGVIGVRLRWWPPSDQVDLNLEFGPLTTLADDFLFPERTGDIISLAAMNQVR
jgi:hypothetical protein